MLGLSVPWRRVGVVSIAWLASLDAVAIRAEQFAVKETPDGAVVTIDGKPFAEYRKESGHQPIVWPIYDAHGRAMTRSYPQGPQLPHEQVDHPHHRSLWFAHGDVNGRDFWLEPDKQHRGQDDDANRIVHREYVRLAATPPGATIATRNDWLAGERRVLSDVRTMRFGVRDDLRWIDLEYKLQASDGQVVFGDTKEGCFSLRVPGSMDVTAKLGGRLENDRGQVDDDAWGRCAAWVNYAGPVEGKPAGIAVFIHPRSTRSPHRWHVRTYGLFAANPFARREFPQDDQEPQGGPLTIAPGESATFRYLVLLHDGDLTPDQLADWQQRYAADRL
ncbi:MAG: PmoA family protein [Pirellulales bacterium]|nr:PmoA family protein [Pirellulales bacterium]